MFKSIRTMLCSTVIMAGLAGLMCTSAARADDPPNMQDYNTFWQVAEDPTPPSPSVDYNTYWAEVQAKQIGQAGQ